MRTLLAMIIVVGALSATATWAKAPVGSGKVFSGSEGEQVALVPLTEKEGMEVLLYIQGTGGAFDGKVLLHEIVEQQGQVDYRTQFRGEPFLTLTLRVKADGQRRYQLNMPGRRLDIPLSFDEARTRALDAESVYALHQKQKADGTLARLMSLDREARMAAQDQALAKAVESLNAACGTSVIATIDWSTISDEVLKERSISSFCKAPISALKRLCSQDTAKQTLQAEVRTLSCRFGEALKLELTSGHVSWTTSP